MVFSGCATMNRPLTRRQRACVDGPPYFNSAPPPDVVIPLPGRFERDPRNPVDDMPDAMPDATVANNCDNRSSNFFQPTFEYLYRPTSDDAHGTLYESNATGDEDYYLRSKAHRALEHLRSLAPPRRSFSDDSLDDLHQNRNVANTNSSFRPVRQKSTRSGRVSKRSAFSLTDRVSFTDSLRDSRELDELSSMSNNFSEMVMSRSISPSLGDPHPPWVDLDELQTQPIPARCNAKPNHRSFTTIENTRVPMTHGMKSRFTNTRSYTATRNFSVSTRGGASRRSTRKPSMGL